MLQPRGSRKKTRVLHVTKWQKVLLHTPERPRNACKTCSCRKAGGTHSISGFFRSDFGFVLLWLPRKFFLLREFHHTAHFLLWATEKKERECYKMFPCLAFLVVICFIYCLLDCILPRYLLNFYPPYTCFSKHKARLELLQCLQKPVLSKNPSTPPRASTGYQSPQFFSILYAISINFK